MSIRPVAPALRANLIILAGRFGEARGLSPTYVSKLAFADQDVLDKLHRDQGSFSVKTYDKWVAKFRAMWPKGLAWPRLSYMQAPPNPKTSRRK